jgi:hypothetical protein
MIRIKIPTYLPKAQNGGALRVCFEIGTLGFVYSEVLPEGHWKGGAVMYAPPDTVRANFEVVGKINSRISSKIQDLLDPDKNFDKISRKSQKNKKSKGKTL